MSGNAKFRWILLAPLLLAILFTFGCASISYTPVQGNEPWFREAGRPKVFIHEFDSQTGGEEISHTDTFEKKIDASVRVGRALMLPWYVKMILPKNIIPDLAKTYHPERPERPFCGTFGGINCPQLFKDVFTKEFQALGL